MGAVAAAPETRSNDPAVVLAPPGRRRRVEWILVAALILVAIIRIVSTYSVFSQTYDEPAHIAVGMEWLDKGTYHYEPLHPPLPRVAVALGPYISGLHSFGEKSFWTEGNRILWSGPSYMRTLAFARLGVLPFFIAMVLVVFVWTRALYGSLAAVLSAVLLSTLPPILAHAGVATTDLALASTLPAATLCWTLWLDDPSRRRSIWLGVTVTLTLLSKLSALLFIPAIFAAIVVLRWVATRKAVKTSTTPAPTVRRRAAMLLVAAGVSLLVLWAAYRFTFTQFTTAADRPHDAIDARFGTTGFLHNVGYALIEAPLPAGYFLQGIQQVFGHSEVGRLSFLLGDVRRFGWWYFFPVAFLVKTPLATLALFAAGIVSLVRRRRELTWKHYAPAIAALALMVSVLPSTINIGLRLILPIYAFVAIVAAAGAAALLQSKTWTRQAQALVAALLLWQVTDSVRAHPDYLAYFNETVRSRADRVLMFSDLDWGQDTKRLADTVRARKIDHLWVALNNTGNNYKGLGFPLVDKIQPYTPVSGWVAADLYALRIGDNTNYNVPPDGFSWIETLKPVAQVGPSTRLYFVPEETARRLTEELRRQGKSAASVPPPTS